MVAKVKFKVDPTLGAIGLYRDPDDNDEALADPLNHLDKVIFHPELRYCGIVDTITGTLSLPATTNNSTSQEIVEVHMHTLAAHGQTGRPMILGVIKEHGSGGDVAWCGSIPVQQKDTDPEVIQSSITRWITLGADDTNLVVREQRPRPRSSSSGENLSAIDVDYEIHIFDIDLESALPSGDALKISNATGVMEIETPKGLFSMSRRYLKVADSGGLVIPGGKTIQSRYNGSGFITWRCFHGSGGFDAGHYRWDAFFPNVYPPTSWTVNFEELDF